MNELTRRDNLTVILLSICLILPAFVESLISLGTYKQLIIGSIVNTMLFLTSYYIKDTKKVILMSVLPSISSMATGFMFNGLTLYSSLMMPFIWLGNLSIVYLTRVFNRNVNLTVSSLFSILIKVAIIYSGFLLMSNIFNYPTLVKNVMNSAMGITQIYTALLGLLLSTGIRHNLK